MKGLRYFVSLLDDYNLIMKHFGKRENRFSILEKAKAVFDFTRCTSKEKLNLIIVMQTTNYELIKRFVFNGKI